MQSRRSVYSSLHQSFPSAMLELPVLFRIGAELLVGASVLSVANSRKELALLAGTFLVGLSTLELMLHAGGF